MLNFHVVYRTITAYGRAKQACTFQLLYAGLLGVLGIRAVKRAWRTRLLPLPRLGSDHQQEDRAEFGRNESHSNIYLDAFSTAVFRSSLAMMR